MQVYTIILVDDHIVLRSALKELIEKMGPYKVIGEFDTGKDFTEAFPLSQEPDLLVLDMSMPEMDGTQVMKWMKEKKIRIKTLVLTVETDEEKIINIFRLGIRGYLNKNSKANELKTAIEHVLQTGYYHNEILAFALETSENSKSKTQKEQILENLSEKELHFLSLLFDDSEYTYDQIATKMYVHLSSVEKIRVGLFEKFHVKSKTGILLFAMKNKLFSID